MKNLSTFWAMEPKALARLFRSLEQVVVKPQDIGAFFDLLEEEQPKEKRRYEIRGAGVAVIPVFGVLSKSGPSFIDWLFGEDGTATVWLEKALTQALGDSAVQRILLHIESPGGTVAGTFSFADAVWAARGRKPLWAYIEDIGASAAYNIASQTDHVLANPVALVGSIGTYATIYDQSKRFDAAGIKVHIVKAGEMKGAFATGTNVTEEQLADQQRVIDDLNAQFIANVVRGRGMKEKYQRGAAEGAKPVPADGRVWVAGEAQALGLIDGITTLNDAIAQLSNTKASNPSPSPASKGKEQEMTKLSPETLALLGLAADASDEDIQKATTALLASNKKATETIGALTTKVDDLVKTIDAQQKKTDEIVTSQLDERLSQARKKDRVNAMLDGFEKDGRINAAQRKMTAGQEETDPAHILATANPDAFEHFVKNQRQAPVADAFRRGAGNVDLAEKDVRKGAFAEMDPVKDAARLDAAAKAYAEKNKVEYDEAVEALTTPVAGARL